MSTGQIIYTTAFWWSVGLTVVFTLAGLICIGLAVCVRRKRLWEHRDWRGQPDPEFPNAITTGLWAAAGLVLIGIVAIGWFPYDMQYHARVVVSGTVETVDSRMLGSKDSFQQKFVVTFEDSPQEWGCEDTRCATVKPGDRLELLCTKQYDWNATDGWDCGWGRNQGGDS